MNTIEKLQDKITKKNELIESLKDEMSNIVERILDAENGDREKLAKRRVDMQEEIELLKLESGLLKTRIVEETKKEYLKQIEVLKAKQAELQKEHAGYLLKLDAVLVRRHENGHKGVYIQGTLEPVPTREAIAIVAKDAYETNLYTSLGALVDRDEHAIQKQIRELESRL